MQLRCPFAVVRAVDVPLFIGNRVLLPKHEPALHIRARTHESWALLGHKPVSLLLHRNSPSVRVNQHRASHAQPQKGRRLHGLGQFSDPIPAPAQSSCLLPLGFRFIADHRTWPSSFSASSSAPALPYPNHKPRAARLVPRRRTRATF